MKVLVIGGQGVLGRPVVRRLVKDGFAVRVMARTPEKAKRLLPPEAEVVRGDLRDVESLGAALKGCGAVYLTVDTLPKASFRPETDGLKNLVEAARREGSPRLLVLSAIGTTHARKEEVSWWHVHEKIEAQKIARESGLPWTIFEPTWFWESIPLFIKGKTFAHFKGPELRAHWVAGDDLGRMISAALAKNLGVGEVLPVQGTERLTITEAAERFIKAYDSSIRIRHVPFFVLRLLAWVNAQVGELVHLFGLYSVFEEPAPSPLVWERFGKPMMGAEEYAAYVKATGDFPQKG